MSRMALVWIILSVLTLTLGCRICSHPYDYCGPIVTGQCGGGCGGECCPNGPRAGSVLSAGPEVGPTTAIDYRMTEPGPTSMVQPDSPAAAANQDGGLNAAETQPALPATPSTESPGWAAPRSKTPAPPALLQEPTQ
jgi:hypothetical protein